MEQKKPQLPPPPEFQQKIQNAHEQARKVGLLYAERYKDTKNLNDLFLAVARFELSEEVLNLKPKKLNPGKQLDIFKSNN